MEEKQVVCVCAFLLWGFCGAGTNGTIPFDLTLHVCVCVCPQGSIEERLKQLQDAHRDFGPGSQHFLSSKSHFLLFDVGASCCTILYHPVLRQAKRSLGVLQFNGDKTINCFVCVCARTGLCVHLG